MILDTNTKAAVNEFYDIIVLFTESTFILADKYPFVFVLSNANFAMKTIIGFYIVEIVTLYFGETPESFERNRTKNAM